ncbi:MAG: carboxypeptidase-like regulatory domain-containing protein [Acidobacteriia bacterium]|nr:carboxypeptidase-like regulatory domain-containing protein [Terriglobia bacterium]
MPSRCKSALVVFALVVLTCVSLLGQVPPPTPAPDQQPGSITGTVFDQSGAVVAGARVKLTFADQSRNQEVLSGADGQFTFANVVPGPFQVTITATGFAAQTSSGTLQPGQNYIVTKIALPVAANETDVEVELTQTEVAQEQIKVEEKQRVLGVVPNFYVTYEPNPAPLTAKQKFGLAWKTSIDPVSFVLVGAVAGIQQGQDDFDGYGQGAEGYAKRYGASYADFVTGTFIGAAILPSVLKQDPRYFYKGSGSKRSRILYAMASAVICKGDNGRWQANYSNILGTFAAGGISNLYYPAEDRGAELTFENGLLGIGATAAANLFQEFVIRKLTPKIPKHNLAAP